MIGRTRPVFYGWWVAVTAALALLLGSVPIMVFSFSVFLKPLAHAFHSGRGAVSFAFTLHNLAVSICAPLSGWLADRFGPRKVILPSMLVVGLLLLSSSLLTHSIWQLYAFYLAVGFFGCGAGVLPFSTLISHWFDRHRGLALGVMMSGLGLGAAIMPSLAQYVIGKLGWQTTYSVFGVGFLLIAVPAAAAFLKDRPEQAGLLPDGVSLVKRTAPRPYGQETPGASWRDAWHTRTFWLLLLSFILVSASVQACSTQIAAILADRGSAARAAALASSLLGGGLLLARTGSGYLLDRFFAPYVAALIFAAAALGMGLLRVGNSQQLAFTAAFLVGIALGAEGDIIPYLTSRYFGLRSFGKICGFAFTGFTLAGGLGAYLIGIAFDRTGSYALPLIFCWIAALIGAGLMLTLGPYPFAATSPIEQGAEQPVPELPLEL